MGRKPQRIGLCRDSTAERWPRWLPIAPSTNEDLDDLHFAFNDRVDRPIITNPDTKLPWIRPFDDSDVGLRTRSKWILLEDTQTLHDASSRTSGQFAQLPSRGLRQRDPERHSSSNGMNSSSSRIRFHRASSSLMDALSISSRMTSSYVCPFEPSLRSSSFVSFWREIVVEPAISWPPWSPWYLCLTMWRYARRATATKPSDSTVTGRRYSDVQRSERRRPSVASPHQRSLGSCQPES